MDQSVGDLAGEIATLAFDVLVTIVLTAAGIGAELHSAELLPTDLTMAIWFGYVGLIALYAGAVVFGANRLGTRLRQRLETQTA